VEILEFDDGEAYPCERFAGFITGTFCSFLPPLVGWQPEAIDMSDDVRDIAEFYNRDPQSEHSRLARHQLEFDLTWRYLDQYLPASGSVLEIGAATGRYTLPLAKKGYAVTAVDLSAGLLAECRKNLVQAGLEDRARLFEADARDLSAVPGTGFDAALLMGPLYHLILAADRKLALQQAADRLRSGGILFSAFISRLGILGEMLKKNPAWIEDQAVVRALLESGRRPDDYPKGGFRGYLAHVSEIAPLHEALGLETLVVAGIEPAISADDEIYNLLQGKQRQQWLDLFYEVSTEPSIIGASRHFLYVGRKKGAIPPFQPRM
jgi:S-adenosylmethionine-dependent methyltransferase